MKASRLIKKLTDMLVLAGDVDIKKEALLRAFGEDDPKATLMAKPKIRNPRVLFEMPRGEVLNVEIMLRTLRDAGLVEMSPDGEQCETTKAFHIVLGEGK